MSYSEQTYFQCEDCGRGILERKNKKNCRTCGKILCKECNHNHFGYCYKCRQDFEDRPVEEKYAIMKMFQSALKSGPILLTAIGIILGIASIVLASIFLFLGRNSIFLYIAIGQFPLSLLFFWLASKVRQNNERGLAEVERRVIEFKNQISPEGPKEISKYSTQYRQTTPKSNQTSSENQTPISDIPPIHIIKDPEKRKRIAFINLYVFASLLMISGVIHIGLSFSWYPFIFISMGEIAFSSLLFWLGNGIKNGRWTTTPGKVSGTVRIIRNSNENPRSEEKRLKSYKRIRAVLWFFIVILGIASISHTMVFFFVTFPDPLFIVLGMCELGATILLILLTRVIKNKMERQPI